MANEASERLDQALRDQGWDKDPNDDHYTRSDGRGGREKLWADDDYTQRSDNNYSFTKYRDGDLL